MRTHAGPVEADLQRYYGLRLADLCAGRLTWRRLGVLVRQLPLESATVRSVRGAEPWGATEHLLATVAETLAWANWQRGGGKGPRPKHIRRPGAPDAATHIGRTTRPAREVRAYLARFRPREVSDADHGR